MIKYSEFLYLPGEIVDKAARQLVEYCSTNILCSETKLKMGLKCHSEKFCMYIV